MKEVRNLAPLIGIRLVGCPNVGPKVGPKVGPNIELLHSKQFVFLRRDNMILGVMDSVPPQLLHSSSTDLHDSDKIFSHARIRCLLYPMFRYPTFV